MTALDDLPEARRGHPRGWPSATASRATWWSPRPSSARRWGAARVVSADGVGNGDTPADQFMRTILDGAAAYERELIRARTRAALKAKRARGERAGNVPWGYGAPSRRVASTRTTTSAPSQTASARAARARVSLRRIVNTLADEALACRSGRPQLTQARLARHHRPRSDPREPTAVQWVEPTLSYRCNNACLGCFASTPRRSSYCPVEADSGAQQGVRSDACRARERRPRLGDAERWDRDERPRGPRRAHLGASRRRHGALARRRRAHALAATLRRAAARRLGYARVKLQTNGMMLSYAEYAQRARDAGVTEVAFSIKGATAAITPAPGPRPRAAPPDAAPTRCSRCTRPVHAPRAASARGSSRRRSGCAW
ncbi:MAG: recombinase family protein [Deltaproteobacteria bacterium]|nr:recombinase family protein [Deltaproteobacteria bacterium]